ncbi:DUF4325 domain-containing protein [Vibrio phage vB_VhaM_VH-8]|nr:DUF4325 domain-containing protein [Vibrio phage vB_VhaM_VH-8]
MKPKAFAIDVGLDFSRTPSGRFHSDGDSSAEAFFIHTLDDLLSEGYCVNLEFHNVLQAGSSFLYHLTGLLVSYGYDSRINITKDDKWEYTKWRWDKYIKQHKDKEVDKYE